MRAQTFIASLLILVATVSGRAAEKTVPPVPGAASVPVPAESEPAASRFPDAQVAYVQSWIKDKVPECPPAASTAVAEQFLGELQQRSSEKLARLLSPDFPLEAYESMLLRIVGLKLNGAGQAALREEVARRRIIAMRVAGGHDPRITTAEATGLTAKIKDASSTQYRRLVEGKMDDDDLEILLKKITQSAVPPKEAAPAKPKVLTASEIVSEFSRRNQSGSAVPRLQAYAVEGTMKSATGEEQELLLFKMRPDRFRLVIRSGGLTRYIFAGDGGRFWQQLPGQPTQLVSAQDIGQRLYLAEFIDPLFAGEGFRFERLPDGLIDARKAYRVAVQRPDKSRYIACIDQETYREVGRENEDQSLIRYSDFRDVAGVTYAFREEVTDATGKKGSFVMSRVAPNPGLMQNLFELPALDNRGYFEAERLLAAGKTTP